LASLVPGPEPKTISSAERAKLTSSGTKLSLPMRRCIIERAERGQQDAADDDALREIGEEQVVAERIAQAHHEDETDAGEQQNGGQQGLVARKAAQAQKTCAAK